MVDKRAALKQHCLGRSCTGCALDGYEYCSCITSWNEVPEATINDMYDIVFGDKKINQAECNQEIKADAGKARLTLVPRQIMFDIAKVREYGLKKYGSAENWKKVGIERYRDATFRHFMAYLDDPKGVDKESGLPHLSHLACNIAFLCELEGKNND